MPSGLEIEERFGSRRNNNGTIEYLYWIKGSDDEGEIRAAVLFESPEEHTGIPRTGVTEVEQQGNGLWFATVAYVGGGNSFSVDARQEFEFDTSTGTQHILEAISDMRSVYSEGDDVPDFGTAIGVDSDGNIEGVDIGVKVFDFSVTRKVPIGDVNAGYLETIYDLSWHYNKDADVSVMLLPGVTVLFPAGTILFKGARGGGREGDLISITYLLSFSPNLTNFYVDDILVTSKLGWQYCWAWRLPTVITAGSGGKEWLVPKAKAVYVDDLYESGDLTDLNLETGS